MRTLDQTIGCVKPESDLLPRRHVPSGRVVPFVRPSSERALGLRGATRSTSIPPGPEPGRVQRNQRAPAPGASGSAKSRCRDAYSRFPRRPNEPAYGFSIGTCGSTSESYVEEV